MNPHLISSIIKGVWAINEEAAIGYAPLLNSIFGKSPVAFEFDARNSERKFYNRETGETITMDPEAEEEIPSSEKNIAIIPMKGPLMKNDQFCGPVGMATIGEWIKEADASKNIDGILLHIDSPGGTVDGTAALAEIVANTKKPTLVFADGLMASAALWIGASADEVIAASNRTEIGSIGVLLSFADLQPYYEKLGVKFHSIVADQSKDKTRMWEDLRKGKYDDFKKEVLNPLAEDFISHMRQARPNIEEGQLTGKVFFAQDVVGTLVDSIGNFDYAIGRLAQLIDNKPENLNNNSKSMKKQFANVNKTLGVDALEASEDGVFLNEEQLEMLNSALEPAAQEETPEETEPEEVEETTTEEEETTEPDPRDAKIAELEAQVRTLGGAPAADADPAKPNDKTGASGIDDYHKALETAREMQAHFN